MQLLIWACEIENVCGWGSQFQSVVGEQQWTSREQLLAFDAADLQRERDPCGIYKPMQEDDLGWEDENKMLTKSLDIGYYLDLSLFRAFRAGEEITTGINGIKLLSQTSEVQHHSICRAHALSGFNWWTRIGLNLRIACNTACTYLVSNSSPVTGKHFWRVLNPT